jgi:hypothetical protein
MAEQRLPLVGRPLIEDFGDTAYGGNEGKLEGDNEVAGDYRQIDFQQPHFHRHKETTHIELFYDLFFVANLTVFTYVHEVNNAITLTDYVAFYSLLWFTWYQVGLYDVRFSVDSLVDRVCKALQFGFVPCYSSTMFTLSPLRTFAAS